MSNPANNGNLVGRLARDPKVWENSDGSKKVAFTVFADRNYKNNGEVLSDAVPVEAFVRKDTDFEATPFASLFQGSRLALSTSLRMDSYTRGDEQVYDLKVVVEAVTFLESKTESQKRLAKRAAEAGQVNQQAAAAVAEPVAAVPGQQSLLTDDQVSALQDEPPF
ncbi:single-stranded DNA-binding protein [Arthrobacter castelli]|uniref:single-stranded DNA-binding protein n=1 Tax=Arthrobacter castelli TaxID=271431 RepID=UPI000409991A|nr:single-stranded DNA-binding protein [Arthrobacter castelli]